MSAFYRDAGNAASAKFYANEAKMLDQQVETQAQSMAVSHSGVMVAPAVSIRPSPGVTVAPGTSLEAMLIDELHQP